MAVTTKWRHHIEKWHNSGLTQAQYCTQQQINLRTFTARLYEYRKLSAVDSVVLVPAQIEPTPLSSVETNPITVSMVLTHPHGYRLELSPSVSVSWVAELLRCLA